MRGVFAQPVLRAVGITAMAITLAGCTGREETATPSSSPGSTTPSPSPSLTVPELLGRTSDEVSTVLEQLGLVPRIVHRRAPNAPGTVLAMNPPPGAAVEVGQTVTLIVAIPLKKFRLPSVVGQAVLDALTKLQTRGLSVRQDYRVSTRRAGTVLSQSPAAGTLVVRGAGVDLVVAERPPTAPCGSPPLRGVYHPYRLKVLGTCRRIVGTVARINHEQDGDYHVDIAPAKGYGRLLNGGNYAYEHGQLVTEIMPGQTFPIPYVGERVIVYGTWVYDSDHGWNEIHPIWAITYADTGNTVRSSPVVPPRYDPDEGGGGGGGGGNCDPSYPTVCIPPPPPDLDCGDVPYRNFKVLPPDPHHFDGDHDGIGCET